MKEKMITILGIFLALFFGIFTVYGFFKKRQPAITYDVLSNFEILNTKDSELRSVKISCEGEVLNDLRTLGQRL